MKLECSIRIEDLACPQHSFKRFIKCNLFVGALEKSHSHCPKLYLRTASSSYQYQIMDNIEWVRGMNDKNVSLGKATIGFITPRHYLSINCEHEKLLQLARLLRKFSNRKKIEPNDVAVVTGLKKPASKPKTIGMSESTNLSVSFIEKQHPCLWRAIYNLQKLELVDIKNLKFPVILGQIPFVYVSLRNMGLQNDDLLWLDELRVRSSLKNLCLSHNELTEFPTAVIDCLSLETLNLDHNAIEYIPHGIHRLQKLRVLQMSYNHLHYLPADVTSLKLECIDLTFNYLHSNIVIDISDVHRNFRGKLRLQDWAALNVDPCTRFQMTARDCPNSVLRKLRSLSRCVCDRVALRYSSSEYFVPLGPVRFSASSCIKPQRPSPDECSSNIYLQYHFCTYQNHCIDKRFKKENCFRLVKLFN